MGRKDLDLFTPAQLKMELRITDDEMTQNHIRRLLRSRAVSDLGGKLVRVMDSPSLAAAFSIPELDSLLVYITDDSVSDEIVHVMRTRRMEMVRRLTERPEETARRLSDVEIENLLPYVTDPNAMRVLTTMLSEHAGRREDWLAKSLEPTGPLALVGGTDGVEAESATDQN